MPTLKLRHRLTGPDGKILTDGDIFSDVNIEVTNGETYHVQRTIADGYGNDVLWTTGEGGFDDFELGLIISDQDLAVELSDDAGTGEDEILTFVKANVPFYFTFNIGSDNTSVIDGAALVDNTDFDDIDAIRVQRNVADLTGDAIVNLWLFR